MGALEYPPDVSSGRETIGGEARSIWAYVVEQVFRQGGSFSGVEKAGNFDKLVDTSARLSRQEFPTKTVSMRFQRASEFLSARPFYGRYPRYSTYRISRLPI